MRLSLMLALLLIGSLAHGDQVTTAEAMMTPQIFQSDAGYTGCGVRVVVISANEHAVKGADFSLIVVTKPNIGAMFKAGGTSCKAPCANPSQLKDFHATNYRLSSVKDGVPLKLLKTFPADNPVYTMAVADAVQAMDFLMKIVAGERMQLAFTPDGSDLREIYAFTPTKMQPEELTSFQACLDGALKQ